MPNWWYDVLHAMFVLLGILKPSGLDICSAYSAIWIVDFNIQPCCDRLVKIERPQASLHIFSASAMFIGMCIQLYAGKKHSYFTY